MAQPLDDKQQSIDYANMYNTKYIQLNQMENEKIVDNLQKLHYLQNTISSKDKMIEQVNKNTQNTNDIIFYLVMFFGLLALSIVINFGLPRHKKILFIIIWGYYIISIMYKYNFLYMKDILNPQKTEAVIKELSDDLYDNLNKYWGDEQCEEQPTKQDELVGEESEYEVSIQPITDGIIYQDGTAPNQMINPLPLSTGPNNYRIEYPDYSQLVDKSQNKMRSGRNHMLVGHSVKTVNL